MSEAIVRAFGQLREMLAGHRQLSEKLAELEERLEGHDQAIGNLFEAIRQLIEPDAHTRSPDQLPQRQSLIRMAAVPRSFTMTTMG